MRPWVVIACLALAALTSCGRHRQPPIVAAEQLEVSRDVARFVKYWLEPAELPPPSIAMQPLQIEVDQLRARATPFLAQAASWNQWPRGARLLNDRVAYWFSIEVVGDSALRWEPSGSLLEVNAPGQGLPPVSGPEPFLQPLLSAAFDSERYLLDNDLALRTKAAGAFRAAYLSTAPAHSLKGVVGFLRHDLAALGRARSVSTRPSSPCGPLLHVACRTVPASLTRSAGSKTQPLRGPFSRSLLEDVQAARLRLTLRVVDERGSHDLMWVFE